MNCTICTKFWEGFGKFVSGLGIRKKIVSQTEGLSDYYI